MPGFDRHRIKQPTLTGHIHSGRDSLMRRLKIGHYLFPQSRPGEQLAALSVGKQTNYVVLVNLERRST